MPGGVYNINSMLQEEYYYTTSLGGLYCVAAALDTTSVYIASLCIAVATKIRDGV